MRGKNKTPYPPVNLLRPVSRRHCEWCEKPLELDERRWCSDGCKKLILKRDDVENVWRTR